MSLLNITGIGSITGFGDITPYIPPTNNIITRDFDLYTMLPTPTTTTVLSSSTSIKSRTFYLTGDTLIGETDATGGYMIQNNSVSIVEDPIRGNVLYFNGSSYINTDYVLPLVNTRIFWVKLNSIAENNAISTPSRTISFLKTSNLFFTMGSTVGFANNGTGYNNWVFYALTNDGSCIKLYRNNRLDKTINVSYEDSQDIIQIGAVDGASFLNGLLDNIRVYDRVLSDDQIAEIYNYEYGNPSQFYSGI